MPNPWVAESWRIAGIVFIFGAVGLLFGQLAAFLLLGLLAYLIWHVDNLFRLYRWLLRGKKLQPPEAAGIWGEVFNRLYRLQQRDHRRKRKLAAMVKRFRDLTSALPDVTVVLGPQEDIQWFNTAAEVQLGLKPVQDVGQRLDNLIRHPSFSEYLHRADFSEPVEIPSPVDPERLLSFRVINYGKKQRLVVARDVTRVRQLERMRREFVANVSHEMRTPLTVIAGFLETMEDAEDGGLEPWSRSVELMRQQTARMQHMVEDVLLLSRLEMGDSGASLEDVSVPAMLSSICDDAVLLSADNKHDIQLEADPAVWLHGYSRELHSAFSNLVFNAVKYTPARGTVRICWYADEQGAHLEVSDSGIGIAKEHIPRLTERFYRVDVARSRDSGGTGLGLAIVKHVLNRHRGRLRVESELGKGSTFICDFPNEYVVRRLATA